MNKNSRHKLLILLIALISMGAAHAIEQKLNQAQFNLKKMQNKIAQMKQTIHLKQQTHHALQSSILKKNQQIQKTHAQKIALDKKLEQIKIQIDQLQQQINHSRKQISSFEKVIYNHLNLHLQLLQEPYWRVIFNADNPFSFYQRVTLYQYLYRSEHQTLQNLRQTHIKLKEDQTHLTSKIVDFNQLQKLLQTKEIMMLKQKSLEAEKLQHVSQEIEYNAEQMKSLEKNQAQLKQLIQTLLNESQIHANRPFTVMRKRLNYPIDASHPQIVKSQNGIIFLSPVQAPVHAVSTGKVVFADWLNGYGYLVIIDHGQGFMTLYGNNQQLLKHKGEFVHQGDVIANVGKSGAFHQTGLYFEIRQKARVVSALSWFQKRAA